MDFKSRKSDPSGSDSGVEERIPRKPLKEQRWGPADKVLEIGSAEVRTRPVMKYHSGGGSHWPKVAGGIASAAIKGKNKWLLAIEGSHYPGWEGRVSQRYRCLDDRRHRGLRVQQWPFMAVLVERVVGSVFYNLRSV